MLGLLFEMIQQYSIAEEANHFIQENLRFTSFRERYIDKCMQEQNFHKIVELALEGEAQDKSNAGLVAKWRKWRYTAFKGLSLKDEQQKLARNTFVGWRF